MPIENVTMSAGAMTAQASVQFGSWLGWIIAGAIFIIIVLSLFFLSKNFKRFIYGLPVMMVGYVIGWHSYKTGMSAAQGNTGLLKWTVISIIVVAVSILAGTLIERTAFVKSWEEINKTVEPVRTKGKGGKRA